MLKKGVPEQKKIAFTELMQIFSASRNFVAILQFCRFLKLTSYFIQTGEAVISPLVKYKMQKKPKM